MTLAVRLGFEYLEFLPGELQLEHLLTKRSSWAPRCSAHRCNGGRALYRVQPSLIVASKTVRREKFTSAGEDSLASLVTGSYDPKQLEVTIRNRRMFATTS